MTTPAHVGSTAEIERFRSHLVEYRRVLYRTVELLEVEIHRVLEWVERERRPYWMQQKKLSEVRLAEAEATYSRCMSRTRADQERSCFSEKKIVDRWRQRVAEVDDRLRRLREWQRDLHREAEAFQMQVRRLGVMAEDDLARAIVALDRIQRYLQKYLRLSAPVSAAGRGRPGTGGSHQVSSASESDIRDGELTASWGAEAPDMTDRADMTDRGEAADRDHMADGEIAADRGAVAEPATAADNETAADEAYEPTRGRNDESTEF